MEVLKTQPDNYLRTTQTNNFVVDTRSKSNEYSDQKTFKQTPVRIGAHKMRQRLHADAIAALFPNQTTEESPTKYQN